jgi:hypothetical protein
VRASGRGSEVKDNWKKHRRVYGHLCLLASTNKSKLHMGLQPSINMFAGAPELLLKESVSFFFCVQFCFAKLSREKRLQAVMLTHFTSIEAFEKSTP